MKAIILPSSLTVKKKISVIISCVFRARKEHEKSGRDRICDPRPVVFFSDGRSELMLDLTANKVKRGHLWTWLIVSVERGNSE